jgi:hypothetical protein
MLSGMRLLASCLTAALASLSCGYASAENDRVATAEGELTCQEVSERLAQLTLLRKAANDACKTDSECASAPHNADCGGHCFVAVRGDRLDLFTEELAAIGSELCGAPEYVAICGVTHYLCAERTPRCLDGRCEFPLWSPPPADE